MKKIVKNTKETKETTGVVEATKTTKPKQQEAANEIYQLTDKEHEVLKLVVRGVSLDDIEEIMQKRGERERERREEGRERENTNDNTSVNYNINYGINDIVSSIQKKLGYSSLLKCGIKALREEVVGVK